MTSDMCLVIDIMLLPLQGALIDASYTQGVALG